MYRSIRMSSVGRRTERSQAIAVALFDRIRRLPDQYARLDAQFDRALSAAIKRREYSAAGGIVTTVYPHQEGGSKGYGRLFILGLGEQSRCSAEILRIGAAKLTRVAHAAGVQRLRLDIEAGVDDALRSEDMAQAVGEGMSIANFQFDAFKGAAGNLAEDGNKILPNLTVEANPIFSKGFQRGLRIGQSVNVARQLAATPPNVATPTFFVKYCRTMARQIGLKCTVIDSKRADKLGMGGLSAVGRAGSTPPALICLEYRSTRAKGKPVLLVGKAVTFDTGGISIKPSAGMENMKYDKCGGMSVIGAMHAIARLKLPINVVGLVGAAENMVGTKAYRPSDILTMYNGVTVEVTNTDAEGRLVLADALAYGCKRYKPRAIIDLATLTGGVVVALGPYCAGMFCNDSSLRERLCTAADDTSERLWQLPLWEEHKQQLKGTHGDIVNSSGREAHPIQGAAFLSYFIDSSDPKSMPKTPWAHLDIAGVSDIKNNSHALYTKGPTGFGVRLLVRVIEAWGG